MKKNIVSITIFMLLLVGACNAAPPSATEPTVLTVMTHDSFAVSAELIAKFEADNNASISFVKAGDTGSALNRLILTSLSGTPSADVFYGLDNTYLSRALDANLFEPYQAQALADIPQSFQLDPTHAVLPVDYGDVCINYDKAWFAERNLAIPDSLQALTDPAYAGLLVVENPATSSPGLAFFLATIAQYGADGWQDYWSQLKTNGVAVVSDWETAYYTNFSGSSGKGPQPMVVSYASSPAAELFYAETPLTESPTGSITAHGTCWRQVEFVGILKNTPHRQLAEKFIDFMLSQPFQEDMPLQMFVYPVLPGAQLPEAFQVASQVITDPARLDPALIAANREAWVQAWTDLMLK